mgnify:CR=1 FL=1
MQPSEKPKEVEAVVLKSFLDLPPLESRPSLVERVAKLEEAVAKERIQTRERFAALEARVAKLEEIIKSLEARLCALDDDGWQPEETMYDLEV